MQILSTKSKSTLILPWVCEHPRIEHGIYIGAIHIYFFEILFVHLVTYCLGLIKNIVVMEVLICSFWEWILITTGHLQSTSCIFQFLKHKLVIYSVYIVSHMFDLITNQVVWYPLRVWKTASFIVIITVPHLHFLFGHNLRLSAELLFFILRVIFNDSIILV